MKNKSKLAFFIKFINLLLLVCSLFFLLKPCFNSKFPYTHDGMNHLARFANYKIALKEGQLPPRFAPNLYNHYGYPVFNYNYPLANILSLPFSAVGFNYELTFKILVFFAILTMIAGTRWWLKSLKLSNSLSFSLVVFFLNPFLINILFFRGNIGELWAICLLPALFGTIEYLAKHLLAKKEIFPAAKNSYITTAKNAPKNKKIILLLIPTWTAFLLSHNISVLFGLGFVFLYALFKFGKNYLAWKNLATIFLASLSFSLWFWLPALLEKSAIVLDNVSLNQKLADHFPTIEQLFLAPLSFGFSYLGQIDSLSFALGISQIFIFLIIVLASIKTIVARKALIKNKKNNPILYLALITIIFQLSFTKFIWQIIPLASYIQFPWRLSLFLAVFILPLSAKFFAQFKKILPLIYFLLLLQLFNLAKLKPVDYFHQHNIDYDAFSQSTSTLNENRTKNFTYMNFADWQPTTKILEGEGEIKIKYWQGSRREYFLKLNTDSIIVEPTMNFLGWQTWTNQKKVKFYNDEKIAGRLAYRLPAGEYHVISKFTQQTPARIIGNGLFVVTSIIYLFFVIRNFWPLKASKKIKND